jgi:hypothetical protein
MERWSGCPLAALIERRLEHFARRMVHHAWGTAAWLDEYMRRRAVTVAAAVQKPDLASHALAYVTANDPERTYVYFTHGYGLVHVDRTLLELPCNIYCTHDAEYARYFAQEFESQDFACAPERVLVMGLE